jgi:hypothetical protein
MSTTKLTIWIGLIWSTFFLAIAVLFLFMFLIIWLTAVFKHGYDKANSPTIWVIIPFLTIMWITIMRQFHGIHSFWWEVSNATYLIFTTLVISIQIIFWILGYKMMKENKYFDEYVKWKEKNPWTYTLICPWVALVVFWFFFIHSWLIQAWILEKFSIMYFVLLVPLVLLQIKTILVMLKLNKKFYA